MKVMIVDDDATTLKVVRAALESRGYRVIERNVAIGTTVAIIREKPDVVVLDVRMPGLTGDRLAALIGQGIKRSPIVIFYSSLPPNEIEALVRTSGAAGFVSKGAAPAAFLERFETLVNAAQRGVTRKRA